MRGNGRRGERRRSNNRKERGREGARERAVISRSERSTQAERREIMWKSVISE